MIDSSTAPQLYICLYLYVPPNYACVCIDTFVYFIQYNHWLYFALLFFSIYLRCMGYYTTKLLLHLRFNQYVCEYYIYVYCNMFVYFIAYTEINRSTLPWNNGN